MKRTSEMVSRLLAVAGVGMLMAAAGGEMPQAKASALFCGPTAHGCDSGACFPGDTCGTLPYTVYPGTERFCCVAKAEES